MSRLSIEVAAASKVLENHLPAAFVKPTYGNALIDTAKRLQRLQTKAGKLRRDLRAAEAAIRAAKRELKALALQIGRGE
jgi:hypothetical protein